METQPAQNVTPNTTGIVVRLWVLSVIWPLWFVAIRHGSKIKPGPLLCLRCCGSGGGGSLKKGPTNRPHKFNDEVLKEGMRGPSAQKSHTPSSLNKITIRNYIGLPTNGYRLAMYGYTESWPLTIRTPPMPLRAQRAVFVLICRKVLSRKGPKFSNVHVFARGSRAFPIFLILLKSVHFLPFLTVWVAI